MTPRLALFRWAMATQQRRPSTSSSAVSRSATRGESLRRHRFNLHYETIAGGLLISLIGMVLRRGFTIREQHGFTIHEQRGCALACEGKTAQSNTGGCARSSCVCPRACVAIMYSLAFLQYSASAVSGGAFSGPR